jgi:hypothetical protein
MRQLDNVFKRLPKDSGIEVVLPCHDCRKTFVFKILQMDGEYAYDGGHVYETKQGLFFKCESCFEKNPNIELRKVNYCEVYSRIVGYMRPVSNWNDGKRAEWRDRTFLKMDKKRIA